MKPITADSAPRTADVAANPDSRAAALSAGLEALTLPATPVVHAGLLAYLDLLRKWNQAYNLSAVRDPQQMVYQHLLDCLAALPSVDRHFARYPRDSGPHILDVGSGAGLPGVVWALMRPEWTFCCVDSAAKKTSFVRQVAAELALRNVRAEHARVENLALPPFDLLVSRAFASLTDFTRPTQHLVAPDGCWLAMKGKPPEAEIAALETRTTVFHVEQLQVPGLNAQRCLVWMRPAEPTLRSDAKLR